MKNLEMEDHLRECSGCAQAHQSLQALRAVIRSQASYYQVPATLQARIRSTTDKTREGGATPRSYRWKWLALAASVALVAIGTWGLSRLIPARSDTPFLVGELLASHVRSQMLPGHLVDVESSDRHTVKPWFEGKLDFSPEVADLTGHEFTLVGGRLEYLDRRPVAAL